MLYEFDPDRCYKTVESELAEYVIERDNRLCVLCGRDGQQIHHIIMKSQHHDGGTPNYANNLALLCRKCHDKQHGTNREEMDMLKKKVSKNEVRLRRAIS